MGKPRERQLEQENDRLRRQLAILRARWEVLDKHGKGTDFTKIVLRLITAAAWVLAIGFFTYQGRMALEMTAGKKTDASLSVNGTFSLSVNQEKEKEVAARTTTWCLVAGGLGLIFGAGGILYGRYQAKLRREVIARFHPYQLKEESQKDEQRTSSRLTKSGDTRPEDL